MIGVDTNLLVYAHRRDSEWHVPAARVLRQLAEGRNPWAIPWPCLHEFLAVVTHPRIYTPPSTMRAALDQAHAWLRSPSLVLIGEERDHLPHLEKALLSAKIRIPNILKLPRRIGNCSMYPRYATWQR